MSSDLVSFEEPDLLEVVPVSPDYVPGPEELEQAPLSPDYVRGPKYPEYLAPSDEEVPIEDQPYVVADSPIALSLGYIADSDPEEDLRDDSEDGLVDYPANGGDGDDDSSDNDEEEEASEEEEEENLASANSVIAPVVDHVPSSAKTEPFETDESVATPPPPLTYHTTARISIRPEAPMPFSSKEEVERLLALPPPLPSPLISLSPPSAEERLARAAMGRLRASSPSTTSIITITTSTIITTLPSHVPTSLPLPSSPLPPLPASLFIPPLVDRREDIPKAKLPPRKRLYLTSLLLRYKVGESSTAAPRPTGSHEIDYGFIGNLNTKTRCQRAEEVGYGIRDVWVDPTEAVEEVAPKTFEGVNARVTKLVAEALVSREDWAHFVRDSYQQHWDRFRHFRLENNMPLRRSSTTARTAAVAATPMTAAVKQLIEARVSAALANHETL
ncbi:hypothetical protein Tco_0943517 [Tanacetum coccineum]